jgi:uncharacterized protein (TIGR02284 family)
MAEMTRDPRRTIEHLNALIELDYDAIEAYEAAVARLRSLTDQTQLDRFCSDHRRHVVDLTNLVQDFGGIAATRADFKRLLTKGKVVVGGLVGDRFILEAMRSNEETTTKTYQKAIAESGIPSRVRAVLERNSSDERRHLAWIEQRLAWASSSVVQGRRV